MIRVCADVETLPPMISRAEMADLAYADADKRWGDEKRRAHAAQWDNQVRAWSKLAANVLRAEAAVIGASVEGGEVFALDKPWKLVELLADHVSPRDVAWVGHNLTGFDIPLLRIIAARNAPAGWAKWLLEALPSRRYDVRIVDNMTIATLGSPNIRGMTADALARAVGLPGKPEAIDFVRLHARYLNGEDVMPTLRARVVSDVEIEWATYERLTGGWT